MKRIVWIAGLCLILVTIGIVWAPTRNVAPDAVTKATQGSNVYWGELVYLTDGKYPGNDDSPGVFQWGNKGIVVFELPEPVPIVEIRVYVGENPASFIATFFLGTRLAADGLSHDPEGERKGYIENYGFLTHQWVSLKSEVSIVADYVELETIGGPEMYEVEILAEDGTSVQLSSWGFIKSRFSH